MSKKISENKNENEIEYMIMDDEGMDLHLEITPEIQAKIDEADMIIKDKYKNLFGWKCRLTFFLQDFFCYVIIIKS